MRNFITITIFVFCLQFVNGQEAVPDQRIVDQSCGCINKIGLFSTLEVKNDSVKKCIDFANQKVRALKDVTVKGKNDTSGNSVIDDKEYESIQKKLLQECTYLKKLLRYDSSQFDRSVSENKKALDFYKKGVQYFERGQYDLALAEYNQAVKNDPKCVAAWNKMGICYGKIKNHLEAVNCYKKSLEINPKGNMPLMNMAVSYELLQDYKSASESYAKYIEYFPEDPEGFYGAARMYYLDKNYEKGLDCIFQAYVIYKKTGSPYIHDAEATIKGFYGDMQEKNQLEIFQKLAEKYKIKMN